MMPLVGYLIYAQTGKFVGTLKNLYYLVLMPSIFLSRVEFYLVDTTITPLICGIH